MCVSMCVCVCVCVCFCAFAGWWVLMRSESGMAATYRCIYGVRACRHIASFRDGAQSIILGGMVGAVTQLHIENEVGLGFIGF